MARQPLILKKFVTESALLIASLATGEPAIALDSGAVFLHDGSNYILFGMAMQGTLAARPSAGVERRLYWASDEQTLYFDTGTAWVGLQQSEGVSAKQIENNLALATFRVQSDFRLWDDSVVYGFQDTTHIDTGASVYEHHAAGYVTPVLGSSGQIADVGILSGWTLSDSDKIGVSQGKLRLLVYIDPDGANNPLTKLATPVMTANDAPAPIVVSATSEDGSRPAYKAFNATNSGNTDGWQSTQSPSSTAQDLIVDFGAGNAVCVNALQIAARDDGAYQGWPTDWTFAADQNDDNWQQFLNETSVTNPGQAGLSSVYTWTNGTKYRRLRLQCTLTNNPTSWEGIGELYLWIAPEALPTDLQVAITDTTQLDTSTWSAISTIRAHCATPGSSAAYFAVSTNKGDADEVWSAYVLSTWREIARLNSATWEYKDASDVWQTATVQSSIGALQEAFGVAENQMEAGILETVGAAWSGVFSAGALDLAVGMLASGSDSPTLTGFTVVYEEPAETSITFGSNADVERSDTDAMEVTGGALTLVLQFDPDGANNTSEDYATPVMTSNSTPTPVVISASSAYGGGYEPYRALDQNTGTYWHSSSGISFPQWLKAFLGAGNGQIVNKARFRSSSDSNGIPTYVEIYGSNNDSDYDLLYSGSFSIGSSTWTAFFTWVNSTSYEYYRYTITAVNNEQKVTLAELHLVPVVPVAPAGMFSAHTNSNTQINTSTWSAINGVTIADATPGSSTAFYAVSFNRGAADESWYVFTGSAWRVMAALNTGVWYYYDASDQWQAASVNDRLTALTEAFEIAQNQMGKATLEAIGPGWWGAAFSAGTLDFAFGLAGDGTDVPSVSGITINYSENHQDMDLVLNSWEATAVDPDDGYLVLDVERIDAITLNTDLSASVSIDDGANYEAITLTLIRDIGEHTFIRGDVSGITSRADQTVRLRLQGHNSKSLKIRDAALAVRYTA